MSVPTTYNLAVKQGANHSFTVTYLDTLGGPEPLTGWTAHMQVRDRAWSDPAVVDVTEVYSSDGMISINSATGEVTVLLEAAATAKLSGRYVYDLFVYEPGPGDNATALVQGTLTSAARVTR